MESWLDWYATGVASNYGNRGLKYRPRSDGDIGHHFSRFAAEAVRFMRRPGAEHDNSFEGELAWFGRCIAPFAGHYSEKAPLAVALEPGAVVDFELCDVDDKIRDYAEQALARHSTVYLDLPDRAYMLQGRVFQIRALFIWQCKEGNRFCAVLTRPGSNHGWRIAWLEGRHARNESNRLFDQVWGMLSRDMEDRYRPINFNKIDFDELVEVEKLAWASLACWQYSLGNGGVPAEEVPPLHSDIREQPLDFVVDPPLLEERFSLFRSARIRNINPAHPCHPRKHLSSGGAYQMPSPGEGILALAGLRQRPQRAALDEGYRTREGPRNPKDSYACHSVSKSARCHLTEFHLIEDEGGPRDQSRCPCGWCSRRLRSRRDVQIPASNIHLRSVSLLTGN